MTNISQLKQKNNNSYKINNACHKKNVVNQDQLATHHCQPSNLLPHFWNYKIVDKSGSPDLPCIIILSELFGWFRNLSKYKVYTTYSSLLPKLVNNQLAISYDFLSKKLNFNKERIRRNLVKLEKLGVISRTVRNVTAIKGNRINQLFIAFDNKFFQSCLRDPEQDIRIESDQLSYAKKSPEPSPLRSGEHISNNTRSNIRSIKSQSSGNVPRKLSNHINMDQFKHTSNSINHKRSQFNQSIATSKQLKDFYPLSQNDCIFLQTKSGRAFSLNAMNEILRDMAKRITERSFHSKKGFLLYMSEAFKYEKRNIERVNNINFKIKSHSYLKQQFKLKERYLTKIENSTQVSLEWNLKRKLASVLERDTAYNLLSAYYKLNITAKGICEIILHKKIQISNPEKKIILSEIKALFNQTRSTTFKVIDIKFEIIQKDSTVYSRPIKENTITDTVNIWNKIRKIFSKNYGLDGDAIDKNWMSKINASTDLSRKIINLQAPSMFIKDFIEERYLLQISKIITSIGFVLGTFTYQHRNYSQV